MAKTRVPHFSSVSESQNGYFSAALCLSTGTTEDLCCGMDTSVQHCVCLQRQLKVLRNGNFSAALCLSTETIEDLCCGMDTSVQHCVCLQRQPKTCAAEWTLQFNTVFVYRDN